MMDLLSKNKLLLFIIILLLSVNIANLILFLDDIVTTNPKEKKIRRIEKEDVCNFFSRELKFDEQTDALVKEMYYEYNRELEFIKDKVRSEQRKINEDIFLSEERITIEYRIERIGKKKAEIDKLTYQFFLSVYRLCDDRRKEKFRELFDEINRVIK